jgi:uncharacterized protein
VTTYLDSSAALRIILGAPEALPEWDTFEHLISSALLEVECLRTLDRLRLVDTIPPEEIALRRQTVYDLVSRIDVIELTPTVLARAGQPLPVPLKTLDAIHLAAAALWQEVEEDETVIATHDAGLALAARAIGFRVIGI